MATDGVQQYVDEKTAAIQEDNATIDKESQKSPASTVAQGTNDTANQDIFSRISNSPLSQLGQDFVAEQVAKNGATLINNVDKAVGVGLQPVEKLYGLALDTIGGAVTAQNDLFMYFLQQLAKTAIKEIHAKRDVLTQMQTKFRYLYNALTILIAGRPFVDKYVLQLRQALIDIFEATNNLIVVRDTLASRDIWLQTRFQACQDLLKTAEALMEPPGPPPDIKFTSPALLAGVGVPSQPQQLTVLLAIPQLIKELTVLSVQYFAETVKVNALLAAFVQGYGSLQNSGSKKLSDMSVSTLDNIISQLDSLTAGMAFTLNGNTEAVRAPVSGFRPDSLKTASNALSWLFQLKTIIKYMDFVPGRALQKITVSNQALARYNQAVAGILTKNNRVSGGAILVAVAGKEETGQLESQLTTFFLASARAVIDAQVATNILSLGRTLTTRLQLSYDQDKEIEILLQSFAGSNIGLPSTVALVGAGIFAMLDAFGMDRASDLLKQGNFTDFFNMTVKSVTYVGHALENIANLKECLDTAEEKSALNDVQTELQRGVKSKELYVQRASRTGYAQQKANNDKQIKQLKNLSDLASRADQKCHPETVVSTGFLTKIGNALGDTLTGNIGKGIL